MGYSNPLQKINLIHVDAKAWHHVILKKNQHNQGSNVKHLRGKIITKSLTLQNSKCYNLIQ